MCLRDSYYIMVSVGQNIFSFQARTLMQIISWGGTIVGILNHIAISVERAQVQTDGTVL